MLGHAMFLLRLCAAGLVAAGLCAGVSAKGFSEKAWGFVEEAASSQTFQVQVSFPLKRNEKTVGAIT